MFTRYSVNSLFDSIERNGDQDLLMFYIGFFVIISYTTLYDY